MSPDGHFHEAVSTRTGGVWARKYAACAARTLQRQGVWHTCADFLAELTFDWRHGIRAWLPVETATAGPGPAWRVDAVQYQGASPRVARDLFQRLPPPFRPAQFIDYGCGKGRGLLLGVEAGFKQLIGVEADPELAAICGQNLRRAREASSLPWFHSQILCMDAATFTPAPGATVCFLYNPFSGATLKSVAEILRHHAESYPVAVLYLNPEGLGVFTALGFTVQHELRRKGDRIGALLVAGTDETPTGLPGSNP